MGFISEIFGYVLNFLYQNLASYGLAIMIFSVLLRLLLLPITIKQQSSMKKSAAIQEKTKQLQFKYKNDPERLNKETMQLYKDEKFSPFSGCLSGILQIVIILAVFWLVSQPLTYMVRVNNDETLKNIVEGYKTEIEQANGGRVNYIEISVIAKIEEEYKQTVADIENYDSYVERINKLIAEEKAEENKEEENKEGTVIKEEQDAEEIIEEVEKTANVEESTENTDNKEETKNKILTKEQLIEKRDNLEKIRINMDFFGLNLSKVPSQNMADWTVYVIPGLYVITSFISIKMTTNAQKKNKKKQTAVVEENGEKKENDTQDELMDSMGQMSNTMLYMMPIMSISIAFIAPLGLALYWLVSNILIIFERLVLTKIFKSKEGDENE